MRVYTIGVYESTEREFFAKLTSNKIDTLCDIRQRRGVRGRVYSFVNSKYLQARLEELGIKYMYIKELAPTKEIREKQWAADKLSGENKHNRRKIGKEFEDEYRKRILDKFDFRNFNASLANSGSENIAFLCIEANAQSCHRSLVAGELSRLFNYEKIDL